MLRRFWRLAKTRYVNDKQITDHYAIIPTGQGFQALGGLKGNSFGVYAAIVRRFLSIFYPAAVFQKINLVTMMEGEKFFSNFKVLLEEGYYKVSGVPGDKRGMAQPGSPVSSKENGGLETQSRETSLEEEEIGCDTAFLEALNHLRKGSAIPVQRLSIKEGETSPPKRYNSGSMILAMENAGQLIEDEELRAQIKGSGIGTSATRAEILKKLVANKYIALNKKTQILNPTLMGEMIFDVVNLSIRSLLNPELTASWEKGLNYVAEGTITPEEYMTKLEHFIRSRTDGVLNLNNQTVLRGYFDAASVYYKTAASKSRRSK